MFDLHWCASRIDTRTFAVYSTIFINDFPKSSTFFATRLYADDTSLTASGSDLDSLLHEINTHTIINIVSGGRGELACCSNFFVRDCLKKEFKECHTTSFNRGVEKKGVVPSCAY